MLRQYELVELVKSYDPDADEDALNRAYVFAMKKHVVALYAAYQTTNRREKTGKLLSCHGRLHCSPLRY